MLKTGVVQVSGRGSSVDFTIDDTEAFDLVVRGLREYLADKRGLWSNGAITVNVGRRMQSPSEVSQIKQVLQVECGLTVTRFWCSPEALEQGRAVKGHPATVDIPAIQPILTALPSRPVQIQAAIPDEIMSSGPDVADTQTKTSPRRGRQADALFIKTTCRSGESIRYSGDVVVLADVNPGAEIVADGDVVVFGRLRGVAHAGAGGDSKATIIARQLEAPRLQIGQYIGLPSKTDQRDISPESEAQIAYVRRRSIYVAPFAGRYARYGRGILYDG
ncbi:MAG: septum site-determining protein MinC [SAR202 cluster bacterium Io17-Chloro-G9]|nr:MAG: septum site-determining protein MinC [SAR202 cluster bacterium Io17-Chloro-G9]